jgi:hypothetical protein
MYAEHIARADGLKNAIQSAGCICDSRKRMLPQDVFLCWRPGLTGVLSGASTMTYFSPSALTFYAASGGDLGLSQHGEMK